jgi:hypothetical protein
MSTFRVVIRSGSIPTRYRWEVHRDGAAKWVSKSPLRYTSEQDARDAGEREIASLADVKKT